MINKLENININSDIDDSHNISFEGCINIDDNMPDDENPNTPPTNLCNGSVTIPADSACGTITTITPNVSNGKIVNVSASIQNVYPNMPVNITCVLYQQTSSGYSVVGVQVVQKTLSNFSCHGTLTNNFIFGIQPSGCPNSQTTFVAKVIANYSFDTTNCNCSCNSI